MSPFPLTSTSLLDYNRYLSSLVGNDAYVLPVASSSAFDLLETEILTSSQASVTFSSLNSTYGSDYQHLQLRIVGRNDNTANTNLGAAILTPNSYSGGNMTTHWLDGNGSTVTSSNSLNISHVRIQQCVIKQAYTADAFGAAIVDILDPFSTSKYKTFRGFAGAYSGEKSANLTSGLWPSTDALDTLEISLLTPGSKYVSGSRFSLYGIKAA